MSMPCESDRSQRRDQIFRKLNQEIKQAKRNTWLRASLCRKLERLSLQERSQLVNQAGDNGTPLFAAARKGVVEIVRYLIETCGADLEQRGPCDVEFDPDICSVTPLWCAAVRGKIEVCRVLVKHGANLNTMAIFGKTTPVHAACHMRNIDVVEFLVGQGADVNWPDYEGGTCLINSLQSTELCAFLLEQGADINARDPEFKTALHHAVDMNLLETTKLLLKHGADHLARDFRGDDALQAACLMGRAASVEYLIETMIYPPERGADAFELLGATYLVDGIQDETMTLKYWRRAVTYRELHKIEKKITEPPKDGFLNRVPFCTLDDVNALAHHTDEMRLQSLIVNERVLGPSHQFSIFRLMWCGQKFANNMQYQRCIDLWKYRLEIRLSMDTEHLQTYDDLRSLIKITFDAHAKHMQGRLDAPVRLSDVMFLLEKLIDCLPLVMQLKPVFVKYQEYLEGLLENVISVLHLAEILPKSAENTLQLERMTRKIVVVNPVMTNGNTLLHTAVGGLRGVKLHQRFSYNHRQWCDQILPDPVTTRLLLRCGAQVEAVNEDYSTPLHIASLRVNYREEIVRMLLDAGAHTDRTNKQGKQPYRMLGDNPKCRIKITQLLTLKCLAASKVKSHHQNYEGLIPRLIEDFIRMH